MVYQEEIVMIVKEWIVYRDVFVIAIQVLTIWNNNSKTWTR
jgi:hypothetical protein